jgi:uncharacterized protein YwgA
MKGLFLFQNRPSAPRRDVDYVFKPYDYGPFTPQIYRDVEALSHAGLLMASSSEGQAYRVTESGRDYLSQLTFPLDAERDLDEIREDVVNLSFRDLLRKVYSEHPDSARRSVAKDIIGDIGRRPHLQ